LSGCAVGPDYRAPDAPAVDLYTEKPQPNSRNGRSTRGEAQRFEVGQDLSRVVDAFGSSELDELMRAALAGHPTLAARRPRSARRGELERQYAVLYPSVDAAWGEAPAHFRRVFRQSGDPGSVFNLYNASVNVSYAIDVAAARGASSSLRAGIDSALSARGHISFADGEHRDYRVPRGIAARADPRDARDRRIAELQLRLVEKQFAVAPFRARKCSRSARSLRKRARTAAARKSARTDPKSARVLIGKFRGKRPARARSFGVPAAAGSSSEPASIPAPASGHPAAEAILHQTNARIGVAQALMFPQLTLSGSYGVASTTTSNLFDPGNVIWNVGANLLQPISTPGNSRRENAAQKPLTTSLRAVQQTVLARSRTSRRAVALEFDAIALKAQAMPSCGARKPRHDDQAAPVRLASYLALFNAQRQYEQARIVSFRRRRRATRTPRRSSRRWWRMVDARAEPPSPKPKLKMRNRRESHS